MAKERRNEIGQGHSRDAHGSHSDEVQDQVFFDYEVFCDDVGMTLVAMHVNVTIVVHRCAEGDGRRHERESED